MGNRKNPVHRGSITKGVSPTKSKPKRSRTPPPPPPPRAPAPPPRAPAQPLRKMTPVKTATKEGGSPKRPKRSRTPPPPPPPRVPAQPLELAPSDREIKVDSPVIATKDGSKGWLGRNFHEGDEGIVTEIDPKDSKRFKVKWPKNIRSHWTTRGKIKRARRRRLLTANIPV